ncbi:hypothetical protein ACFSPU_07735 [Haoranjiania flava]|uniref:Copper chaperone NosL n=1 Tax=Haoranjiania flava TaxID=1856322 RepID=A0AAE3IP63_9BACT|nr:hypothetical protein [Haoranjiania flava]MCU7694538.1 hypothetical protein [Haoranjiania flava]
MKNLSTPVKILLVLGACFMIATLFVPMWFIDLDAPQYPEGLRMLIYPNKIGGDYEIINGLNHYIGMREIHQEDFIEFKVLPYLLIFIAVLYLLVAFFGRKKHVVWLLIFFIIFGVVSMYDFWRWEYDYGHNLDPHAAIQVPGMAYQPPLIGYKQLLNFNAFSFPHIGGWLIVAAGLILILCLFLLRKRKVTSTV